MNTASRPPPLHSVAPGGPIAMKRIPGLDGLRAISIVLVLVAHASGTRGFPKIDMLDRAVGGFGELGVRVFFVISGFLITSLLMDEQKRTNAIAMKSFYLRRAIRILPAMYLYFAGIFIAERLGWTSVPTRDWIHAFTFTMNYHPHRAWWVGHLWSLSVEEQFYLVWPLLIVVVGIARSMKAAAVVVVLCPIIRMALLYGVLGYRDYLDESFETVADSIAIGCVLAGVRDRLWANASYRRLLESPVAIIVAAAAIVVTSMQVESPSVFMSVGETAMNMAIAVLIDWCARNRYSAVGKLFDGKVARFIGVRSYSLYLWQQAFVSRDTDSLATTFPLNIVLACLVASASFTLVEKPLMKLRSRLAP